MHLANLVHILLVHVLVLPRRLRADHLQSGWPERAQRRRGSSSSRWGARDHRKVGRERLLLGRMMLRIIVQRP